MSRPLVGALLALAACGEVKTNKLADAPAGSDSAVAVDASKTGAISVNLIDIGGTGSGVVGAEVIFTDATGTKRAVTDATGTATADVEDGASVTAVQSNGTNNTFIISVLGAKRGDHIKLGEAFANTNLGTFTVNVPLATGSGVNYSVFGPCGSTGSTGTSLQLTMFDNCASTTTPMELLVVATNPQTGAVIGSLDQTGVMFTPGGSTTISGSYQPFLTMNATIANTQALSSISLTRQAPDEFGFNSSAGANGGATSTALSFTGPLSSTSVISTTANRAGLGQQQVIQRVGGTGSAYSLDISATVLPWLGSPQFDRMNGIIHVPVDNSNSSGDTPDLFFAEAAYVLPTPADGGTQQNAVWLIFSDKPGDITLPPLPPEFAALAPAAAVGTNGVFAGMFDSDDVAGYDQARLDAFHFADVQLRPHNVMTRARTSTSTGGN